MRTGGDGRDLVEQIMVLYESSAGCPADSTLVRRIFRLRLWAVWSLNRLGDSAAQAILIAEPLLADQERELGADHPDTLATRNELAEAYRGPGRTAEAIILFEQNLADRERVLGADHPDTLFSRSNLAAVYRDAGRTAEAITLHEQTLADRERVLGAGHRYRTRIAGTQNGHGRCEKNDSFRATVHSHTKADRTQSSPTDASGTG